MIARELEQSLHNAFVAARTSRHQLITVEHLLLALLDNPSASEVLRMRGASIGGLRQSLTQHIAEQTPLEAEGREVDTQPTLGFQRVIQQSILHVQSMGKKEVTGADVLVAIVGERDSPALYFLRQQGIDHRNVVKSVLDDATEPQPAADARPSAQQADLDVEGTRQIMLLRDEQTPVEFAMAVLQDFLLMDAEEAADLMDEVRREGKAVCGLFPRETAEFVLQQISAHARKHGYPLRFVTAVQK